MQTIRAPIAKFRDILISISAMMLFFFGITQHPQAHGQSTCQTKITDAEQRIHASAWNEALQALAYGLEAESCSLKEAEQIYVLLARAYDAKGERDFARASQRKLLRIAPNWKPDSEIASPSFQSLAQEALAEAKHEQANATQSPSCKKWPWITAGAAVVSGAIVYLIFNAEEKDPSLTPPPPLP